MNVASQSNGSLCPEEPRGPARSRHEPPGPAARQEVPVTHPAPTAPTRPDAAAAPEEGRRSTQLPTTGLLSYCCCCCCCCSWTRFRSATLNIAADEGPSFAAVAAAAAIGGFDRFPCFIALYRRSLSFLAPQRCRVLPCLILGAAASWAAVCPPLPCVGVAPP
ncbi:hypothetical protein E2C01_066216 [Portunus trituberculatus]|uniref:Uncharacterized protein n=1 Tax=Portunus trituberculatus TaxID=210409 RepID=A0A5B7HU32_PORTR|nr:hypothetical protein [Portunus trituberculatus]